VTLESMWNPPAPVSPDPPPWTFTSPKSSLPLLIPARTSSAEVTSTSAARAADDGASPSEFVSAASTPRPPSAVSFGLEVWQKQISELEGELSQLREESQHLQVMNAELNEEVHARTEDITALEVRRTQAVYACTDVEGRIQHAQGSLATLQAEILAHTASRGRAQADLQHAQLQLSRTNCALDDVQSRLDARQSQLSAADLSLAEVMRDIDTKKAELHKLTETGKLKDTRLVSLGHEMCDLGR
jgi:predicted  nucleic acid-binding Zn-ribbon protein